MDYYNYYIVAEDIVPIFALFVETRYEDKVLFIGPINDPIWGHKKKSCRCIFRSFYNYYEAIAIMRTEKLYKYTIIKSGLISKDLLIKRIPKLKRCELI